MDTYPKRHTGCFQSSPDMLDMFKYSWPCHGFPDNLTRVVAEFDRSGDLVDLTCYDGKDILDSESFDGSALAAFVQDIQDHGKEVER